MQEIDVCEDVSVLGLGGDAGWDGCEDEEEEYDTQNEEAEADENAAREAYDDARMHSAGARGEGRGADEEPR